MPTSKKTKKNIKKSTTDIEKLIVLVEKQSIRLRELEEKQEQILKRMNLMTLFNVLRSLAIIIPLILLFIYVPPIIRDFMEKYQEIMTLSPQELLRQVISSYPPQELREILNQIQNAR